MLDGVAWRNSMARLSFEPGDGMEVVCTGRLTTYPGRSKYQLVIERMEPAGVGALLAQLEERRRRLEAEGLFDPARKKDLPVLPELIGIVTSPTGAVIRDILHRLEERFPRHVLVWPVAVQGDGARHEIAAAINGFCKLPASGAIRRPDLLIVARGGGSIEDLWAFNEEVVVRAAAACTIPLISAVGHETDTTLIDFVADRRAPTPTAAAEIAVPVRRDLLTCVDQFNARQGAALLRCMKDMRRELDGLGRALPDPGRLLAGASQRLDDLSERLRLRTPAEVVRMQRGHLAARGARLDELAADALRGAGRALDHAARRLHIEQLAHRAAEARRALARTAPRLERCLTHQLQARRQAFERLDGLCHSLGPERVLERGYAFVRDEQGRLVTTAQAAQQQPALHITFKDGTVATQTGSGQPRASGRARPRKPAAPEQKQLL